MKNQTHISLITKLTLFVEYNLSVEEFKSFSDQQWLQLHEEWLGYQEYLNG
jgi:hypothetical protein